MIGKGELNGRIYLICSGQSGSESIVRLVDLPRGTIKSELPAFTWKGDLMGMFVNWRFVTNLSEGVFLKFWNRAEGFVSTDLA